MAETIIDVLGGVDTHGDHVAALVDTVGRILDTATFRHSCRLSPAAVLDGPPRFRRAWGSKEPAPGRTVDAEAAARAALNGEAKGKPKAKAGPVEVIRALRVTRRSAMKGRTQAFAQLRSLVTTTPDELRTQLRSLITTELVATAVRFRPADPTTSLVRATKLALREVAARIQFLEAQVDRLDTVLGPLVTRTCPS